MTMHPRIRDLTGLQVSLLTVIRFAFVNARRNAVWLCQRACGNTTQVRRESHQAKADAIMWLRQEAG
jgi:hypothetical protein